MLVDILLRTRFRLVKKFLLPKQIKEHGLSAKDLKLSVRIIEKIIEGYTRENQELGD